MDYRAPVSIRSRQGAYEAEGTVRDIHVENDYIEVTTYEGGLFKLKPTSIYIAKVRLASSISRALTVLALIVFLIPFIGVGLFIFFGAMGMGGLIPSNVLVLMAMTPFIFVPSLIIVALVASRKKPCLIIVDEAGLEHVFKILDTDLPRIKSYIDKLGEKSIW